MIKPDFYFHSARSVCAATNPMSCTVDKELDIECKSTSSTATNIYCTLGFGNGSSQAGDSQDYEVMRAGVTKVPDLAASASYEEELYEVMHSAVIDNTTKERT